MPTDLIGHYDQYWDNVDASYPHYPTIRHRKRFIMNRIAAQSARKGGQLSVFDFGCGEGTLLQEIQTRFHLDADHTGGSDISPRAVELARGRVISNHLYVADFPAITQTFDVIICSEVLEHTPHYRDICAWMYNHLSPGGEAIITTQAGKIHASDLYTGHTQHFKIPELRQLLKDLHFRLPVCRLWGWPLFTIQKYLTDVNFEHVKNAYLEGTLSVRKRIAFSVAYWLYFIHDLIPYGPQIYISAIKD